MIKRLGAVILAAGFSQRMGQQKLLLPLGNECIFSRVLSNIKSLNWYDCIAVIGQPQKELSKLCLNKNIRYVYNDKRENGQSSSICIGLKNLSYECDGFIFILGDQPLIPKELLKGLTSQFMQCNNSAIIVPSHKGQRYSPVLFGSTWRKQLMNICGDSGGRTIINNNFQHVVLMEWPDKNDFLDADTVEDYELLERTWRLRNEKPSCY